MPNLTVEEIIAANETNAFHKRIRQSQAEGLNQPQVSNQREVSEDQKEKIEQLEMRLMKKKDSEKKP
jgi:hypothetical protein